MTKPPAPHPAPDDAEVSSRRWRLIRDLVVFTAKAALEALRDLVLIPLTPVVGLVGLLTDRERPDRLFREVVEAGHRFDRWLNLFGDVERRHQPAPKALERARRAVKAAKEPAETTIDDYFARLEAIVVEQHRRGGVTESARESIERALDRIQESLGSGRR